MLKLYFKVLGVVLLFGLQFIFALPYYLSSNNWLEFTLGCFLIAVVDPIIVWHLCTKAKWK
jgi:hypothetical protein